MQGRLVGKRVTGHYFLDEMVEGEGMHACNYLLAVDSEMEPLPGYRFASWETGYPDLNARPDLATLRLIPWLDKTALVLCDLQTEEGEVIEVAPRQILKRQVERVKKLGYTIKFGAELEFYLFRDSYEEAAAKGYRDLVPHSTVNEDYHILQTTRDEYLIRQIRNGMDGAGVPVEFSKGEAGRGQHEINLAYAEPVEMADRLVVYKNGVKEIAALNGRAITFMAKASMTESGSSLHIHSSVWGQARQEAAGLGRQKAGAHVGGVQRLPRGVDVDGARAGLDVRAVCQLLQALPAGVVGADRNLLGPRQPHRGVPHRRPWAILPGRMPHPRRRRQSLPGLRHHHRRRHPRD